MQEDLYQIRRAKLFNNISDTDIISFLSCNNAKIRKYRKEEIIFLNGEETTSIGIVLEGSCHIIKEDFWGNKHIIGLLNEGEIFGEVFALQKKPLEISVQTKTPSKVLLLNISNLLTICQTNCSFHAEIIKNLVKILASKTYKMNQKLEHITKKNMKDKILSYLSSIATREKSQTFEIPFNRIELAEFLGVERTALSKELSKLQKEGYITFKKNHFTLHEL